MDMSGMEGMTGSMETMDMAGVPDMTSVIASSLSPTASAAVATTPTLLASESSETTHREEEAVSSAAQMGSMASMSGMSGMSGMSNTFHFGIGDTLWATPLTPTNGQGYAGAIILLILMALSLRFLTTVRGMVEKRWSPKRPNRCNDDEADNYLKMGQSRGEGVEDGSGHRWNTTIQLTRALFQLTTMTIGYLLMLAVMTYNLGYLLAILAGGFLGELALGWIKH